MLRYTTFIKHLQLLHQFKCLDTKNKIIELIRKSTTPRILYSTCFKILITQSYNYRTANKIASSCKYISRFLYKKKRRYGDKRYYRIINIYTTNQEEGLKDFFFFI